MMTQLGIVSEETEFTMHACFLIIMLLEPYISVWMRIKYLPIRI